MNTNIEELKESLINLNQEVKILKDSIENIECIAGDLEYFIREVEEGENA